MTARSLFNIILKILGVFFIKDLLMLIPNIVGLIALSRYPDAMPDLAWSLVSTVLLVLVEGFYCYVLLFKTEWVINLLQLDLGFGEEILPILMHRSTILSISVLVIGGLLVIYQVPEFFRYLIPYMHERSMNYSKSYQGLSNVVSSGLKVIFGVLLIVYPKTIVNLIERQRK